MKLKFTPALNPCNLFIAGSLMTVVLTPFTLVHAQTPFLVTPQSSEAKEAMAYQVLFRQSLTYNRLADEADAAGKPDPHFRRILATRLHLSENDAATLLRLSLAYEKELEPIQKQATAVVTAYRAKFPFGQKTVWQDAAPPTELAPLHLQQNGLALRYRDLLRNAMREEDFQKMIAGIDITFGQTLR